MGILALAVSNPAISLAALGIAASAAVGAYVYVHHKGYVEGEAKVQAEWDAEKEARRVDAAKRTEALASDYTEIIRRKDAQIVGISKHLDSALTRLSDRPRTRLPDTPATSIQCKGATGTQLSGPDAEFLTREAARGDEFRAYLKACYDEVDSIRLRLSPEGAKVNQ